MENVRLILNNNSIIKYIFLVICLILGWVSTWAAEKFKEMGEPV